MTAAIMAAAAANPALMAQGGPDPVSESDRLLGVSKSPASAQPAAGVASVNVSLLMLLHPRMQLFNFEAGTFEKEFPAGTGPEGRAKIVQERAARRAAVVERDRARLEELNQQRLEVSQQLGQWRLELNQKLLDAKNEAGQTDVASKVAKLQEDFQKGRGPLAQKLAELDGDLEKLREAADEQVFVSRQQLEALFEGMESEILEAVESTSRLQGYGTVLNSSFVFPDSPAPSSRGQPGPQAGRVGRASVPALARETGQPEPAAPERGFDNSYATFWATNGSSPADARSRGRLAGTVTGWLKSGNGMRTLAMDRPVSQLVLAGGRDLTAEVLAHLLRKHKMPEERTRLLFQALRELQRKS